MGICVEKYQLLRARKKALQEQHDAEMKPFKEAMEALETHMLAQLNESDTSSMRTPLGLAYKTVRTSYTVDDPSVFRAWVESNERPDFYENRPSKDVIEAYLDAGNPLPPGLKVSTFTQVNVRK